MPDPEKKPQEEKPKPDKFPLSNDSSQQRRYTHGTPYNRPAQLRQTDPTKEGERHTSGQRGGN